MPQDLEKTESNITVKGIFIIPTIDEIKKRASEKEIAMLSKLIPNLKVSPFVSYPVLYQNESEKILCRILYGNYNYDAYLKFGRRSFNSFANSNIGKVMMSLFGNSPQKIIMNTQRLFDTVTKGIKIETKKISENKKNQEIFFNLTFVSLDSFKNPKTSSTFVIFYFHYITNQKKQTISVNCG